MNMRKLAENILTVALIIPCAGINSFTMEIERQSPPVHHIALGLGIKEGSIVAHDALFVMNTLAIFNSAWDDMHGGSISPDLPKDLDFIRRSIESSELHDIAHIRLIRYTGATSPERGAHPSLIHDLSKTLALMAILAPAGSEASNAIFDGMRKDSPNDAAAIDDMQNKIGRLSLSPKTLDARINAYRFLHKRARISAVVLRALQTNSNSADTIALDLAARKELSNLSKTADFFSFLPRGEAATVAVQTIELHVNQFKKSLESGFKAGRPVAQLPPSTAAAFDILEYITEADLADNPRNTARLSRTLSTLKSIKPAALKDFAEIATNLEKKIVLAIERLADYLKRRQ